MQVIERKRETLRNGFPRERGRRIWPALAFAVVALAAVSWEFGPSAALLAAGIGGAVVALTVVPSVRRVFWATNPGAWRFVVAAWFVITLGLCVSFVMSAMSSRRAAAEARATMVALGLCAAWFALTRMRRANGAYRLAMTVALVEVGRLLALGMRPQLVSYFIWVVAALVAWRTLTYRSSLSF